MPVRDAVRILHTHQRQRQPWKTPSCSMPSANGSFIACTRSLLCPKKPPCWALSLSPSDPEREMPPQPCHPQTYSFGPIQLHVPSTSQSERKLRRMKAFTPLLQPYHPQTDSSHPHPHYHPSHAQAPPRAPSAHFQCHFHFQ
jgi:hypothetical protein